MFLTFALISALAVAPSDTLPASAPVAAPTPAPVAAPTPAPVAAPTPAPLAGPIEQPVGIGAPAFVDDTTPRRRRKAIEVSDAYALRLKIHYIASFATIPIFAAQAIVGQQLYVADQAGNRPSEVMRGTHNAIAVALGGLFVVNSVTGGWNWWETRKNEEGRTWRTVHSALMLISDAGFAYTASLGPNAKFTRGGGNSARTLHKNWAIGSASVALASYVMMWKPFRRD